ncbi:hypothetical protein [Streptomyces gardneri]|uniref:hypothetical protein n=1 Tax=Streptomyces gardneri TaxID=66892 RepID=UPI003678C383
MEEWSCAGLTSVASASQDMDGDSSRSVHFTLLAYDSVDNAKVGMKTMAADSREAERDRKPLTLDIDADEVDAFEIVGKVSDPIDKSDTVTLRIGTVVAHMFAVDLPRENSIQFFARLQAERIVTAASGKNPDA